MNKKYNFKTLDASMGFSFFVLFQYIVIGIFTMALILGLKYTTGIGYLASFLVELSFIGCVLIVCKKRNCNFIQTTTLNQKISVKQLGVVVLVSIVAIVGLAPLSNIFLTFLELVGYESASGGDIVMKNFGYYILFLFLICVVPAFCEESLFRGLIFKGLSSWNVKKAVLLSALFFMIMHGSPDQTVHQFLLGIILALLFLYSGSIWAPMIAHFLNNFISLSISYIFQLGSSETAVESSTTWAGWGLYCAESAILILLGITSLYFLLRWFKTISIEQKEIQIEKENANNQATSESDSQIEKQVESYDNISVVQGVQNYPTAKWTTLTKVLFWVPFVILCFDWINTLLNGFGVGV